jgi:hypothetical protein
VRFVLLAEGKTEKWALGRFFKCWLDGRLKSNRIGVKVDHFAGSGRFLRDFAERAEAYLLSASAIETVGVIGLLDFYKCPRSTESADFERDVNNVKFRMFFAMRESEAWLLSEPDILPREVRAALPKKIAKPELVNTKKPPAKLLNELYIRHCKRAYRKAIDGQKLFAKLNPEVAREKCPRLRELLDVMLEMARAAGS